MRPLFSCLVPVKGSRPFFDAAIASLRAQDFGDDLEIIVQDADVEPDAGQSDALNRGFAKARGEWFFWLNADDLLLPNALRKVASLDRGSVNWIAGNTVYCTAEGVATDVRCDRRWHEWLFRHLPVWTNGPSAFFRRELWARHGGFDTSLRYVMDIDLWTRWARAGERFAVLNEPIWAFRWHEGSLTSGSAHVQERDAEWSVWLRRSHFHCVGFYRMLMRATQIFDGSYFQRLEQTLRWRGKNLPMVHPKVSANA